MNKHAKVYFRAADLIAERGHLKGEVVDSETGAMCLIGALGYAREDLNADDDGYVFIKELLRPTNALNGVAVWNDAPERTPEEVIDLLISAAYIEEGEV